jgi:hypothetical protein
LEVVDAPNGVHELRGIVDGDANDGEQADGSKEGEADGEERTRRGMKGMVVKRNTRRSCDQTT